MNRGNVRARRVGWLGIALISLVTACSSPLEDGAAAPPIDVRPLDDPTAVDQPLNSYIMTDREMQLMFAAEGRLRADCVARFGLRFDPLPVDLDVPDTFRLNATSYVNYDEAKAQQYGYHPGPDDEVESDPPPPRTLDPQVRALLTGESPGTINGETTPAGGCVGEARRVLREDTDPKWDENFPNTLAINLQGEIEVDARVVAEFAEWSACMKASGFDYVRPRDAWSDPAWQSEAPTAVEKAVAVAEVRCGRKTALAETVAAVERAYQERVVEQQAQQLADFTAGKDAVLRRVSTVLGR